MNRRQFGHSLGILGSGLFAKKAFARQQRNIYLTIDDGPSDYTELILKNLKNNNVIFYMEGSLMSARTGFNKACKALEKGNIIGNHSFSHPVFPQISYDDAVSEIERTDEIIERAYRAVCLERTRKFFRFPYGEKKGSIMQFLKKIGYETQGWNVDTNDWMYYERGISLETILRSCAHAHEEEIVLIHESGITAENLVPFFVENYGLMIPRDSQRLHIDPAIKEKIRMYEMPKEK